MPSAPPDLPMTAPPGAGPVCVGFSGGLDSTVLLHRLARDIGIAGAGLRAIHVHHGLHANADAWAMHCAAICDAFGVALDVVHVTVEARSGTGPEAAARGARYDAFAAQLPADAVLALAHHRDDQAETFLLRALRASGPDGLAGIPAVRRFQDGWLWRPLLALPRAELRAYALAHGLHWIEDPSNAIDAADRNFVRNRVLPLLRTRWPDADAAFADAAALQRATLGLLETDDALALADVRTLDPAVLRAAPLQALPAARRARVLRRWIAELGLAPLPRQGLDWCEATLARAADDRLPCFDWAGYRLQRWRDLLHAAPRQPALPATFAVEWQATTPLALPDGDALHLDGTLDTPVHWHVHARRGGERIALPGRTHTHSLKHVLQDLQVPPWVRGRLPVISDRDGRVLAAGDLVFDRDFDAWLRGGGRRLRWHTSTRAGPQLIA